MGRLLDNTTYRITSPFGPRIDPINGKRTTHSGIDIVGNPQRYPQYILCHTGGICKVSYSATWGNYVDVTLQDKSVMRYAHLAETSLKTGYEINEGDRIGVMGKTGRATGVHLHFGIKNPDGEWIDPKPYLKEDYLKMNQNDFNNMLMVGLAALAARNPPTDIESQQCRQWAQENHLVKGGDTGAEYQALITKQQALLLLYRALND